MKHNFAQVLRDMKIEELQKHIDELRQALFSLRLNLVTSHVKDVSQFKKLRRTIARGLTVLGEKQNASSSERVQ